MVKYDFELKFHIVEEYLERVRRWINLYKKFGAEGLKRKIFSFYSFYSEYYKLECKMI